MVFPVVMYGCESWTVKKAEHWRIDPFELWCWRRLLRVPWTAGISTSPPCPSPTPRVHSDSCPSRQWCHPAISSSLIPFSSCPQSLPASGSYPVSQLFASGGQSTGVSASTSVLPMNTQWESNFLGRLTRILGVPKERGVWNSQGRGKDKRPLYLFFFFTFLSLSHIKLFFL